MTISEIMSLLPKDISKKKPSKIVDIGNTYIVGFKEGLDAFYEINKETRTVKETNLMLYDKDVLMTGKVIMP